MNKKIMISITLLTVINSSALCPEEESETPTCSTLIAAALDVKTGSNQNLQDAIDDPHVPQEWRDAFAHILAQRSPQANTYSSLRNIDHDPSPDEDGLR